MKAAEQAQSGYARSSGQDATRRKCRTNPDLLRFATAGGAAAFQTNCAPCHGRGAQGFAGYPNLNDDDWIWGGSIEDIHKTILLRRALRPQGRARRRRCPGSASTTS